MNDTTSPPMGPTHFTPSNAPPTPPFSPQIDPLDDIYGSAPNSPLLSSHNTPPSYNESRDEILSDLPSRQRALDTDAYREGLSTAKLEFVQEGFDEGYSLGANLGQRVGYIVGVLQGLAAATRDRDEAKWEVVSGWWESAQKKLAIEELLGMDWVDEEGIWKWEVHGEDGEPTFREVADQHPTLRAWREKVDGAATRWGVDLKALEEEMEEEAETQS